MRWESVASGSMNETYHLVNDDRQLLRLVFNPASNTARMATGKEKRVFLVRQEGFRRNRTILRSEYGIKVGELGKEGIHTFIEMNDERFYYTVTGSSLLLAKTPEAKPLLVCGLDQAMAAKKMPTPSCAGLLMALCWHMFQPVEKTMMPVENMVA